MKIFLIFDLSIYDIRTEKTMNVIFFIINIEFFVRAVIWIVDNQRLMLLFYNMIDFEGASRTEKYIKW